MKIGLMINTIILGIVIVFMIAQFASSDETPIIAWVLAVVSVFLFFRIIGKWRE